MPKNHRPSDALRVGPPTWSGQHHNGKANPDKKRRRKARQAAQRRNLGRR